MLVYLAIPFGLNGSPPHFDVFGDALAFIRQSHGVADPDWDGSESSITRLYSDCGIFVELLRKNRMEAFASQWDLIAKGLLGEDAINEENIDEAGIWIPNHGAL